MSSNNPNRVSALNTNWHNRSPSSVTSDAATFHTADGHMELSQMETSQRQSSHTSKPKEKTPSSQYSISSSPRVDSSQMSRQDSGFSDGVRTPPPSSRRTSTSSTSHRPHSKRTHSTSQRPNTHRATRSFPTTTQLPTSKRPSISTRHTTQPQPPYEFYHFPTLSPTSPLSAQQTPAPPPPPPATCQYWTSDSTRRLEYAAIDAASRGVRGFLVRLVPDCILPKTARRTRLYEGDEDGDGGSDAGSVRRYRIPLEGEKRSGSRTCVESCKKPGLLKRLSSSGKGK